MKVPPITTRLERGWKLAREHLSLAAVPLVVGLFATDKIGRILAFDGGHFGVRFALPADVVTVWTFVSVPADGVNLWLSAPTGHPLAVALVPAVVVLRVALGAGYFGSIHAALRRDEYAFVTNVRRHFVPFLLYSALPVLGLLPLFLLVAGGSAGALGPTVVLLLPVVLLLSYLFYATPYLVVLRGTDLLSAARGSYALAVSGGPYARFAVGFATFVFGASLLLTVIVVNLGPVGVVLGLGLGAPLGLACNVATMEFVADVDPESSPFGTSGASSSGLSPTDNHHR